MSDVSGTTTYGYDTRNRLKQKQTAFGTLNYTYDSAGDLLTLASDLLPWNRTGLSMISDCGKGTRHVEERAQRSADDRGAQTTGSGTQGGGRGARSGGVQAQDLRLESEVRRDGRKRGAGSEAIRTAWRGSARVRR
jgi:hypothetical protein